MFVEQLPRYQPTSQQQHRQSRLHEGCSAGLIFDVVYTFFNLIVFGCDLLDRFLCDVCDDGIFFDSVLGRVNIFFFAFSH